jgi:hypothetical protein
MEEVEGAGPLDRWELLFTSKVTSDSVPGPFKYLDTIVFI